MHVTVLSCPCWYPLGSTAILAAYQPATCVSLIVFAQAR